LATRAEAALRANEARLRFLDRLGKETAKSRDADVILAITTRMLGEHLAVSSCAYADMDPNQDGFTIRGDWAAPGAVHIVGHYSLADFGKLAVKNLGAGQPLIVNDNLAELEPHEAVTFQAIGIGSTICMPLVKEGHLTALMAIHHKGHVWTNDELALLTEVTERSWAHIERVRAEQVAFESVERFQLATQAAMIGTWISIQPRGIFAGTSAARLCSAFRRMRRFHTMTPS
jgi:GAF domain-containing protein